MEKDGKAHSKSNTLPIKAIEVNRSHIAVEIIVDYMLNRFRFESMRVVKFALVVQYQAKAKIIFHPRQQSFIPEFIVCFVLRHYIDPGGRAEVYE
jgi:hypothetical protein